MGSKTSATYSNVLNPRNLNGIFLMESAGVTFHPGLPIKPSGMSIPPGTGIGVCPGVSYIKLGKSYSDITNNPGMISGCDKSLAGSFGSPAVAESKIEKCECNN